MCSFNYNLTNALSYFSHFEGHGDCGIKSTDIYVPPTLPDTNVPKHTLYCKNRASLLDAMSGGGRHGFDKPYFPAGCHYRWYSTAEICMILERFDAVVFVGDDSLKPIYAAFNVLLREDMATGGLKQWELNEGQRDACKCDNQLAKPECSSHLIMDSEMVREKKEDGIGHGSPFACDRKSTNPMKENSLDVPLLICIGTPHVFLAITDSAAPEELHTTFTSLTTGDPDAYKPIPLIHSATSLSVPKATDSMDEWITLADTSGRNMPILWVGPNAAGPYRNHPPDGHGPTQGAVWQYTLETAREADARQVEALGMYNLTLQASGWDGGAYGQRVGLVQAMMVRV